MFWYCIQHHFVPYQLLERCILRAHHILGFKDSTWVKTCYFHKTAIVYKRRKTREEKKQKNIIQVRPKSQYPVVQLPPQLTVAELSQIMNRHLSDVFEAMSFVEGCNKYRSPKSEINDKTIIREIVMKLGFRVDFRVTNKVVEKTIEDISPSPPPNPDVLVKRPPVVTIMGHVDHGKTTLLDSLRHSSITAQEHGGITQHIGAFTVKVTGGRVTFLDTPGHAAFHAMRSRGAHATDIVVLVVAADDGIMEQTVESIKYANQAKVPMIVAINKIDKPGVDINQVRQQLLTCGIQLEEFGGEIQSVCISALKGTNLVQLTEAILTLSEMMEVQGDPVGPVEGIVLESKVESRKGKIATVLIQRGTLKKGKYLVAGTSWAKVRNMFDEHDKIITEAPPSTPVQVSGWKSLPEAGDIILEANSEKHANRVTKYRTTVKDEEKLKIDNLEIQKKREQHLQKYKQERQERLFSGRHRKRSSYFKEKEMVWDSSPSLSIVLKGDVHGSVEAIMDVLNTYNLHDECRVDVLCSEVGDVSENDIELAEIFDGIVYCFNNNISPTMKNLADEKEVQIRKFNVIYHLIDDLKKEISSRLPLSRKEEVIGEAVVIQEFLINEGKKKVPVAGSKCTKGILKKGNCKVMRSEDVIYDGKLISLKHEKSDVDSIKKDVECGLKVEDTAINYQPGDVIICYTENYVPQDTSWNPGF